MGVLPQSVKLAIRTGSLGRAVAASEIVDHTCEKHVKKAAANLVPPVGSTTSRQLHLRNRLAAKGELLQMHRHALAAKYAAARVRGLFSKSAHRPPVSST